MGTWRRKGNILFSFSVLCFYSMGDRPNSLENRRFFRPVLLLCTFSSPTFPIGDLFFCFLSLIALGLVNIALTKFKPDKAYRNITTTSMLLSILSVLCLALARVPYATTRAFLLFIIKGVLLLKCIKQM